jgi:hypothetical protein
MKKIAVTPMIYLSADSAQTEDGTPIIVLGFGAPDGPCRDYAISENDARQLAVDVICRLADLGDEKAAAIRDEHFFIDEED